MKGKIQRSASRVWEKNFLDQVVAQCRSAGYDTEVEAETIKIGLEDTDQTFLIAIKSIGSGWLTRYDQALFDESLLN
jgi:hypothetical protein